MKLFKAKPWDGPTDQPNILPPFAHEKLDGHHIMIERAKNNEMFAFTTSFLDIWPQVFDYPWAKLAHDYLLNGTQLSGELVGPEGGRENIKTLLKQHGPLDFKPFATTRYEDEVPLNFVQGSFEFWGFDCPRLFNINAIDTIDSLLLAAEKANLEGWILKRGNYLDWYKIKVERTLDVIISRLLPGKKGKKYANTTGALSCEVYARPDCRVEVASVSGMDDEQRFAFSSADIGRVIEIKYQRVGSDGRLQHPRFLRFRDDKAATECNIFQDPALINHWLL